MKSCVPEYPPIRVSPLTHVSPRTRTHLTRGSEVQRQKEFAGIRAGHVGTAAERWLKVSRSGLLACVSLSLCVCPRRSPGDIQGPVSRGSLEGRVSPRMPADARVPERVCVPGDAWKGVCPRGRGRDEGTQEICREFFFRKSSASA